MMYKEISVKAVLTVYRYAIKLLQLEEKYLKSDKQHSNSKHVDK